MVTTKYNKKQQNHHNSEENTIRRNKNTTEGNQYLHKSAFLLKGEKQTTQQNNTEIKCSIDLHSNITIISFDLPVTLKIGHGHRTEYERI